MGLALAQDLRDYGAGRVAWAEVDKGCLAGLFQGGSEEKVLPAAETVGRHRSPPFQRRYVTQIERPGRLHPPGRIRLFADRRGAIRRPDFGIRGRRPLVVPVVSVSLIRMTRLSTLIFFRGLFLLT